MSTSGHRSETKGSVRRQERRIGTTSTFPASFATLGLQSPAVSEEGQLKHPTSGSRARFFKSQLESTQVRFNNDTWSGFCLGKLATLHQATGTEICMGVVIALDFYLNCWDIDSRSHGQSMPNWADNTSTCCFAIYCIDFALNCAVNGYVALLSSWAICDIIIITSGSVVYGFSSVGLPGQGLELLRLLRLCRILRLLRLLRKNPIFKELRRLVLMSINCLNTYTWCFLFCFIVTTVWSMIAVELINPIIQDMVSQGAWPDCDYCHRAFDSVMRANLTLYKTIIVAETWCDVAVPVIEAYPWTALFFIGSHLSLVYGVLNLMVAVAVDRFANQRQHDIIDLAEDLEADAEEELKELTKLFKAIDEDCDGVVTYQELLHAARSHSEFQSRLRVMDIDELEFERFFEVLDDDGGGTIDQDEFKQALSRWLYDSKTATRFIKHDVQRCVSEQIATHKQVREVHAKVDQLRRLMKDMTARYPKPALTTKSQNAASFFQTSFEVEPVSFAQRLVDSGPLCESSEFELLVARTLKGLNSPMATEIDIFKTQLQDTAGLISALKNELLDTTISVRDIFANVATLVADTSVAASESAGMVQRSLLSTKCPAEMNPSGLSGDHVDLFESVVM